jgi:two-component system NtrC family sensor kinase
MPSTERQTLGRGIATKLLAVFSLLLAIFAAASVAALVGLFDLHRGLHSVERDAGRMQRMLELASAVRDQYAHMAHTIIIGDDTHLSLYRGAAESVAEIGKQLARHTVVPEERRLLEEVLAASRELERIFYDELLPAVQRKDNRAAAALHDHILEVVSSAQEKSDRLAQAGERSIAGFGKHAQAVQHVAIRWMLLFMIAALLCAVGVGIYLYRTFARPLSALAAGAARIGSGDLDTTLEVGAKDELGRLAEQFNAMTKALKDHQHKLVQSEKLAGIGRLAAGVAHEINNPLGVILGYIKLLRRNPDQKIDAELKIIEDEAEQCRQVVEDLLDLTRTPPLELEAVPLRELCEDIVRRLQVSSGKAGPRILVRGEGLVMGSGRKLHQVIHNLVKNAVEASGDAGIVEISIDRAASGAIALSVSDTGPGIRPQDRDLVFEPFFTTKPTGSGLGLAVSRAIARAHGGDLEVAASASHGAVFQLTLPGQKRAAA